jgi:hypothetical protein
MPRSLRPALFALFIAACSTFPSCIRAYVYESSTSTFVQHSNFPTVKIDWQEQAAASDPLLWIGRWTGPAYDRLAGSSNLQLTSSWTEDGASHETTSFVSNLDRPTTQPTSILIHRDAGTLTLNSSSEASLRISPDYLSALSSITGESIPPHRGRELFHDNLKLSFARSIKEAGYKPTYADLVALDRHGVRADFAKAIRDAGYDFSIADVITLNRHGLRADNMRALKEAGFNLTAGQLIELDRHGIRPDYARDMRKAGFEQTSQIIDLDRHGISANFVRDMNAAGFKDAGDIIDLNRHGISAADVTKFKKAGYEFSKSEVIDLNRNGVSSDSASQLKSAGYTFPAKDLIDLNRNGVSADYARQLKTAGYDFTAQDLIKLNRHGVPSTFAAALRDPTKSNLSPDTLIDLNNKGLDADTIKKIRGS